MKSQVKILDLVLGTPYVPTVLPTVGPMDSRFFLILFSNLLAGVAPPGLAVRLRQVDRLREPAQVSHSFNRAELPRKARI